ncbi:hypothetical protein [Pseudooceanicola marinus]|uniref:hypothetical protein n=1 Tax=Pseudooceanicola marinus TaxID=396013 RepID=UPI001CD7173E|nr:hypothetical protein [Pseudooceanicola marinus]MCA1338164.1 hypothetical protein [Pseudooceanicola marinus]
MLNHTYRHLARGGLNYILIFLFLMLCTYPMVYLSYRFFDPAAANSDFFRYYHMYLAPGDFTATYAPFIYRQGSAFLTHWMWELGVSIPSSTAFEMPGYDRDVYLAAILVNYLSIIAGFSFIFLVLMRHMQGALGLLVVAASCLVPLASLQVIWFGYSGLTDGFSLLLFCIGLYFYLSERWVLLGLLIAISIGQRELVPIFFGILSAIDLLRTRRIRPYLPILGWSIVAFLAYVLLRKAFIPVEGHETQLSVSAWVRSLMNFRPDGRFILQGFLLQNVVFLSLVLAVVTLRAKPGARARLIGPCLHLAGLFGAILMIGIMAKIGSNVGRIEMYTLPLVAVVLAQSILPWVKASGDNAT